MAETRASALVRDHINQVLQKGISFGVPCLDLPSAGPHFGIKERGDIGLPSFQAGMEKIYREGLSLKALESLPISSTSSFEVFSTIAASPHTVFAVPYSEFASQWQKTITPHPEFSGNDDPALLKVQKMDMRKTLPHNLLHG